MEEERRQKTEFIDAIEDGEVQEKVQMEIAREVDIEMDKSVQLWGGVFEEEVYDKNNFEAFENVTDWLFEIALTAQEDREEPYIRWKANHYRELLNKLSAKKIETNIFIQKCLELEKSLSFVQTELIKENITKVDIQFFTNDEFNLVSSFYYSDKQKDDVFLSYFLHLKHDYEAEGQAFPIRAQKAFVNYYLSIRK